MQPNLTRWFETNRPAPLAQHAAQIRRLPLSAPLLQSVSLLQGS